MRSGSCASEEGRVKRGELTEATWARNIFAESTTVFIRACSSRERGRERGRDKAHINKATCIVYLHKQLHAHVHVRTIMFTVHDKEGKAKIYMYIYTQDSFLLFQRQTCPRTHNTLHSR